MTETEQQILAALRDLDTAVARCRTENPPPPLLPVFERLDALAAQLPPAATTTSATTSSARATKKPASGSKVWTRRRGRAGDDTAPAGTGL